jgi:hypothetical protein
MLRKKIEKESVRDLHERKLKEVYDPQCDWDPRFPEFRR